MVAAREATWRRRNMARRIGVRNQSWIAVAEPEERPAKAAVIGGWVLDHLGAGSLGWVGGLFTLAGLAVGYANRATLDRR